MPLINESHPQAEHILEAEIASLLKVNPAWFIGSGAVLIILGLLALSYPVGLTLASTVLLGIFLIIGGVAQLVMGFAHSAANYLGRHTPRWETILTGACLLIGGLLMCRGNFCDGFSWRPFHLFRYRANFRCPSQPPLARLYLGTDWRNHYRTAWCAFICRSAARKP